MKITVLATGVFDLLHEEHKNFLQKAKEVGDVLIVGIESDVRVRKLKGEGRPMQPQEIRLQQVQSLHYVDEAFLLPEEFGEQTAQEMLLEKIKPDILAVSSHSPYQEKKKKLIEKYGGRLVVVHQHNPDISTTSILRANGKKTGSE